VEVSGGLRTLDAIRDAFAYGAGRVQLGSAAVQNPALVRDACVTFPGRICVSIDARGGEVMTDGWIQGSGVQVLELAHRMVGLGAPMLMFTDIGRDGMLSGPNVEALRELAAGLPVPVIASGGVTTLDHLRALAEAGCAGAIVGKALYEGAIDLREALAAVTPC
jgi:phosphoribosylformimino-5-aminoimidazole carboxamide ribotide isomerase